MLNRFYVKAITNKQHFGAVFEAVFALSAPLLVCARGSGIRNKKQGFTFTERSLMPGLEKSHCRFPVTLAKAEPLFRVLTTLQAAKILVILKKFCD